MVVGKGGFRRSLTYSCVSAPSVWNFVTNPPNILIVRTSPTPLSPLSPPAGEGPALNPLAPKGGRG